MQKTIGPQAMESKSTLLLDVCCGTGTIGLSLADMVSHVIGVDNNLSGILDARHNASANSLTNATFITANAEHVLGNLFSAPGKRYDKTSKMDQDRKQLEAMEPVERENLEKIRSILQKYKDDPQAKIVAVVDPARAGLHSSVVRALRSADRLNHVIYVSCNPSGSCVFLLLCDGSKLSLCFRLRMLRRYAPPAIRSDVQGCHFTL